MQMFFLNNVTHCQVLSVTLIECGQTKQTRYLVYKAILGKIGGIYATYVTDVDKGK